MKKNRLTTLRVVGTMLCVALGGSVSVVNAEEEVVLQAKYYDAGRQNAYDSLYAEFTALYPHIKVETMLGDMDYQTMIASDSMPDLIMGEYMGLYDFGSAGYLVDLSEQEFLENYPENILSQMTAPDGKVYGIPSNLAGMGIFYNQEMFEDVGITEFPKTISGLKEVCDKLVAAGYTPFSVCGSENWTLGQMFFTEIASVQPDVMKFSSTVAGTEEADILMDEMLVGLEALDIQFEYASETSPSNDYGSFMNEFATGKVAMIQMGTWALQSIVDMDPEFTVRYAAVPYSENPDDVRLSANIGVSVAISSASEHIEECLLLMEFLASKEGQTAFGKYFGEIPLLPDVEFEYTAATADVKEYVDAGAICPWSQVLMTEAGRTEGSIIMQEYYFDQISAEEAITGVYENWFK